MNHGGPVALDHERKETGTQKSVLIGSCNTYSPGDNFVVTKSESKRYFYANHKQQIDLTLHMDSYPFIYQQFQIKIKS